MIDSSLHHPNASTSSSASSSLTAARITDDKSFQILPADFFNSYSAIKYINLSNSKLQKIADFTFDLPYLLELDLSGNELILLTAKAFSGAINLRTIDLSHNMISNIQPEAFVNLRSLWDLNLSFNKLHNNSFDRAGVDWIDSIDSLRSLDLSYNQLFYLHMMPYQAFSGLANLETLNLQHNQITLDYGAFASNQNLKTLDLSYNKMTYLDLNFLMSITSLENLFLNGNGIAYASQLEINDAKTMFPDFKSIGLSENSFSCEVLSLLIKQLLRASIELVIDEGTFVNNRRNLRGVACI